MNGAYRLTDLPPASLRFGSTANGAMVTGSMVTMHEREACHFHTQHIGLTLNRWV
jgi:hypothetical protein